MVCRFRFLPALGMALAASLPAAHARASETRGFVVSWFYPSAAVESAKTDCPHGLNPDAVPNVLRMLREQGKSSSEIEKAMDDFPNNVYDHIGMRGRIAGKPANPYLNPTSVPDPNLKLVEGKAARGFNLDGNGATGGFKNPATGESGVDNQLFRAYGCTAVVRADPGVRPSWTSIQWKNAQLQMPAWVIQVSGIDDINNDDDVDVLITSATAPALLDGNGIVQADMTFEESTNPVGRNVLKGVLKNGVMTTATSPEINLNGHRWAWPEMRWKNARIAIAFEADGSAKGVIGGYHKWAPLYVPQMEGGAGFEATLSMDVPGMYYAFRKLADADPDPKTGLNTSISTAFDIELVPAFITPPAAQTTAAKPPAPATSGASATPPGVTLRVIRIGRGVDVTGSNTNQPRDRIVFADDRGRVMYSWDGDKIPNSSACRDSCAETWRPAAVPADAKPTGLWTAVNRPDGIRQWAFRGKPLYTYAPETAAAKPQRLDPDPAVAPKYQNDEGRGHDIDGHQVMEIQPEQWINPPRGILVQEVRAAPGYVLTDDRGMPMYAFAGKPGDKIPAPWMPVQAPQMSLPLGDFTAAARADGTAQWTYKAKPLFTFKGDIDYGDANGKGVDPRFQLALVLPYFMPDNITVSGNRIYGGLLTLTDGTRLYARETLNGGFSGTLRADRGKVQTGEKIGVPPCDEQCQRRWQPVLAADSAQPSGYWTLFTRDDGKKQWAYYGYALYTPLTPNMQSTEVYDDVSHFEALPDGGARRTIPPHWRVAPP